MTRRHFRIFVLGLAIIVTVLSGAAAMLAGAWAGQVGTAGPYDVAVGAAVAYAAPAADTVIECKPSARLGHFAGPFPAVLLIHGGGWDWGDNGIGDASPYAGRWCGLWASWGYAAFSVSYRLTGTAPWPAQIVDVQAAIRWVRAHAATLGVNPAMIVANGDSAGGQLAMIAGYSPRIIPGDLAADNPSVNPQPQLVISQFGPWTFGPHRPAGAPSAWARDYAVELLAANADHGTGANTADTLFVQGTRDAIVQACAQSVAGYRFLTSRGRPASYLAYDGGHEFSGMDPQSWGRVVGALQLRTISFAYARAHAGGVLPASEIGPGPFTGKPSLPVGCP